MREEVGRMIDLCGDGPEDVIVLTLTPGPDRRIRIEVGAKVGPLTLIEAENLRDALAELIGAAREG